MSPPENINLDELAKVEDADDESIDEDSAFNSEDEKLYGKYFSSTNTIQKNVALPIPLQHNTVRIVEIAEGSKLTLSTVCLDVSACGFDRVKLMYRCVYPKQPTEFMDDFSCLCNYLSAKRGGMGLMPCTPVNLEVLGPCKVEFRAEISPVSFVGGSINIFGIISPMDIFVGDEDQYADAFMSEEEEEVDSSSESENESVADSASGGSNSPESESTNEKVGAKRANAKMVLPKKHTAALLERIKKLVNMWADEEQMAGNNVFYWNIMGNAKMADVANNVPTSMGELSDCNLPQNTIKQYGERLVKNISAYISQQSLEKHIENRPKKKQKTEVDSNGDHGNATKKRKMEDETTSKAKPTTIPESTPASDKKLSKKQRKKLAQEKAAQLEETLSAARNYPNENGTNNEASAKKKAKNETSSKTASMTRERRLPGGLVISDVLLGEGAPVKPGKRISLHYTGSLRSTGKVFDKNHSKQHPLVFRQGTGEVIRGLERGLEGMKAGGERVITIPSKLGYGSNSPNGIPPDSDLIFEVKVLKVG